MFKKIFGKKCKHNYDIVKSYSIKSALETMLEKNSTTSVKSTNNDITSSKLIIVYKCNDCNKIKESVFTN